MDVKLQKNYSQGSNTEHSNSESIPKLNIFKVGFQMVQTIQKPNVLPFENQPMTSRGCFVFIFKKNIFIWNDLG